MKTFDVKEKCGLNKAQCNLHLVTGNMKEPIQQKGSKWNTESIISLSMTRNAKFIEKSWTGKYRLSQKMTLLSNKTSLKEFKL